jgi:hypothetical protein
MIESGSYHKKNGETKENTEAKGDYLTCNFQHIMHIDRYL